MTQIAGSEPLERYGKYSISLAPPHQREYRFNFVHDDYDGPGDRRCGFGKTIQECRDWIDDIESDLAIRCSNEDCREIVNGDEEDGLCNSCSKAKMEIEIRATEEHDWKVMRRF